jgi:hypothetical protein
MLRRGPGGYVKNEAKNRLYRDSLVLVWDDDGGLLHLNQA